MKKELIAPCGLNCRVCKAICSSSELKCSGCNSREGYKYKHCMECGIVKCEKRAQLIDIYCDTCPDYPCEEVLEKQTRYTSAYPMYESPMGNLQILRTRGMDALLEREEKYWTCPECSGKISVHDGVCEKCGNKYKKTPVPAKDV